MTDGAQQRAVVHPIIDVLFPTDMVEDPQKFPQFFFLMYPYLPLR